LLNWWNWNTRTVEELRISSDTIAIVRGSALQALNAMPSGKARLMS